MTVDKPVTTKFVRAWRPGAHPSHLVTREVQGETRGPVFRITPGGGSNPPDPPHVQEHFGFEVTKLRRIR